MIKQILVGSVLFVIDMPYNYLWGDKDKPFLISNTESRYSRTVYVSVLPNENLEEPLPLPLNDKEGIRVWNDGGIEIRSFYAFFQEREPLYAISRWQGNRVDIQFKFSTLAWVHPNMVMWPLVHLENQLLLADGLILHSCYTQYGGKAILFTAPSGTGKTTQGNLWKRVYGSDIVNGDLCLLQLTENGWMACGYPMSGSAPECKNESYPIKAVVVVRQAPSNYIEELSGVQKLSLLYSECTVNTWNSDRVSRVLDLLSDFLQKVPIVMLHCNLEDSAASTLHRYLYGE